MRKFFCLCLVLLIIALTLLSGCTSKGSEPNCGRVYCQPPNICCNGQCYQQCPTGTSINSECACVVVPAATQPVPPIKPNLTVTQEPKKEPKLLAWYDFEDLSDISGKVADKSGNNLDVLRKGLIGVSQGIVGKKAILFSGSGYIQADKNPVAGRKDLTISFWFKTTRPDQNYKMASAATWSGGKGTGWTMATHVPEFWADDGNGVLIPAQKNNENNFIPDDWNFEVVTYDGSSVKEYTNGKLINEWTSTGDPFGAGVPMAIGGWPGFGFNFDGSIDDFRVYNTALNKDELNTLYNLRNT
jgi:hypothetical protein